MHEVSVGLEALGAWRRLEGVSASDRPMRYSPIVPEKAALIVIDMQNAFCLPGHRTYLPEAISLIPNINRLARAMREAGGKVVWVQQTYRNDDPRFAVPAWRSQLFPRFQELQETLLDRDTPGYALHAELDSRPEDLRIEKTRWGALMPNSSELHETLQAASIDTVIVAGVASDACVETTVREAVMLDYKTVFVTDATATDSEETHNAAILTLNHIFLVDLAETQLILQQLRRPDAA